MRYYLNASTRNLLIFFIITMAVILMGNRSYAQNNSPDNPPNNLHGKLPDNLKVFYTFGTGSNANGNASTALKTAISNSLISAAESAIIEILPIDVIVDNFQEINTILHNHTKNNFMVQYNVLTNNENSGTYKVIVKTTIDTEKIRQHLKMANIVVADGTMPTILLVISEQSPGETNPVCWWAEGLPQPQTVAGKIISEILQKQGFSVVNQNTDRNANQNTNQSANQNIEIYKVQNQLTQNTPEQSESFNNPNICDLTDIKIISLCKQYKADIAITGEVISVEGVNTMGSEKSFKATVNINAIRADLGHIIASSTKETIVMNENAVEGSQQAIISAATDAGKDMAFKIAEVWKKINNDDDKVLSITLAGYKFYPSFIHFRQELNNMQGVTNVQTKEMMSNKAVLSLKFAGSKTELAKALIIKSFNFFGIEISNETTENNLNIKFIPPNKM